MDWDSEARELLARAPIFVRPLARRKIEEFARARGAARITAEAAQQAYDSFRGKAGGGAQADAADRMPPAALIERLESEAEALAKGDGFRTRHYWVRPRAGAVGCPRSLIPVRETAEALALGARSYQTLVGGKLGRHPRLADRVAATSALTGVAALLDRALNAMMERGKPGERLGTLLAQGRAGVALLLHQEPGVHTKEVADG